MDEIAPKPAPPAPEAKTDAKAAEYAPVVGVSVADRQKLAELESIASAKSARDYEHVIWAYGVLWALFAAYGLFLWRRSARLRADMDDLNHALSKRAP